MVLYFYALMIDKGPGQTQYTSGTFNASFPLADEYDFAKAFDSICEHHKTDKSKTVITSMSRLN